MAKKVLSFTLSFTLLLAMLYVPVIKHTCHLFDVSETTVYAIDKCCSPAKGDGDRLDMNCCSLDIKTMKADISSLEKTQSPQLYPVIVNAVVTTEVSPLFDDKASLTTYRLRPPPIQPYNRSLLNIIQVYRL